jgi:hypothetical protein
LLVRRPVAISDSVAQKCVTMRHKARPGIIRR